MASYTWNASNGGDWNTAANWTPATIPGAADSVDFATGGLLYTVTGDADVAALTVDTDIVTFEGAITTNSFSAVDSALVTIDQPATLTTSTLSFDSGTLLQVDGLLIDNGSGAALGGSADVAVVSGADADFVAGAAVTFNQLYVNQGGVYAGDVILNDGGSITIDTSATFGGGTLTLNGNGTFDVTNAGGDTSGSYGLSEAINIATAGDGLMLASDPGVTATVGGRIAGAGYVDVSSGSFVLASPNTYTGGTLVDNAALTLIGAGAVGSGAVFLNAASLTTSADTTGAAGNETVVGTGGADTVTASAGNLVVFGAQAGSLAFQGGAGLSTVIGGTGVLSATLGSGGGIVFAGSSGQDVLTAGSGAATLVSADGGRLSAAGSATDVLVAGGGNTTLIGGSATGNDIFFTSGTGTSLVETGAGTDTVLASGAQNEIFTGTGTQDIFLNAGAAEITAIDGFAGGTSDIIGFTAADTLHLSNYAPDAAQSALSSAVLNSGNTILTLSDNTHIVLYGFTGLTASNFV